MTKFLDNFFHNMKHLSWIMQIPVLIHLKYWYYNNLSLELPFLLNRLCQLKRFFSTVLIMLFVGFPILSYRIWPHVTSIGYTKHAIRQKAGSLRATSPPKLGNMVNSNSIINTKCAEFSTKRQKLLTISNQNPFLHLVNFNLPITPCTCWKNYPYNHH